MARSVSVAATLLVIATVAAVSMASVRHGCTAPGPPVSRPDPGTPRAAFCGAIGGSHPWLVLAPVAALGLAAAPLRARVRTWVTFAAGVAVALVAVAIVANSLAFAVTA